MTCYCRGVLDAVHRVSKATADTVHHAAAAVQHAVSPHASAAVHHMHQAASVASKHAGNALRVIAHHGGNAAHAARDGTVAAAGTVQRVVGDVADAVGNAAGHVASTVGERVGPTASALRTHAQHVGGAVASRVQPITDAVGSWWTALSEQHKGMVKVAVLLVGVQMLLRGDSSPRPVEGARQSDDIGHLLQKLQVAVVAKVQQALSRGAKEVAREVDNTTNNGTTSEGVPAQGPLPAAQRCVEQTLASLQHTGAAALGALQHAADGAVNHVKQLADRPSKDKPYLG